MIFKYTLANNIKEFIKNSSLEEISIGCSNSQVIKIIKDNKVYFLKIAQKGLLTSEYEKLQWLDGKLRVPKVILYECTNNIEYLITEAVKGKMICSEDYVNNPETGLEVIKEAFLDINSVDITGCPFDVSIDYKIKLVENDVIKGIVKDSDLKKGTLERFGSVNNLLNYLKENKFYDEQCFSHGDTSLPNIFASGNNYEGLIDVGECGMCDKWFDLAICEKSIIRNYGLEYVSKFYKELNIKPDRKKIEYYLLLMEL